MSANLWPRACEIAEVLGRWAGREVVERYGLSTLFPSLAPEGGAADEPARAAQFRKTLEDLGAVFIKLGQLLSTRPDLVSPAYMQALEGLQDRVAPAEPAQIRDALAAYQEELGNWPFRSFDDEPVAAASLAQVHRARLRDGTRVAVKVRRPGVVDRVLLDLRILALAARLAQRYLARTEVYDLPGTVEELARAFEDELDFRSEAESMEVFSRNLADYQNLVVPRVYPRLTTPSVLVMEFIEGRPLREGGPLSLPRRRRAALAQSLAQAYLQMFFLDGVFHADPHPGNLFLTRDGRIGLLDFGMVGRIERQVSDNLIRVLLNFVLKDSHGVAHAFLDIGKPTASADEIGWIMDVRRLLPRYHGMSLQKLNVGTLLIDLYRCAARNRIQAPPIVALVCKSLANMDGSARLIHPEIDIMAEFRRFLPRILKDHARRMASLENNAKLALDVAIGAQRIPFQVATILEKAATGRLRVVVDPLGIDKVASQIGKVANRVALGQILGSWLVARAIKKRDQPPATIPREQFDGPRLESLGALAARLRDLETRTDQALVAARQRGSHG